MAIFHVSVVRFVVTWVVIVPPLISTRISSFQKGCPSAYWGGARPSLPSLVYATENALDLFAKCIENNLSLLKISEVL